MADAGYRDRSVIPRSLPPCPPPTRRGLFKRFAPAAQFYICPAAATLPALRATSPEGEANEGSNLPDPLCPKGGQKGCAALRRNFYINAAQSAATLFSSTPFSEKGVPPRRRGIRARWASLGLPIIGLQHHPGASRHPSVGGAKEVARTERFRKNAPVHVSGPPPRRRGAGGSEGWMIERFRQIAPVSDYVAPPTEGTAAKRQGWFVRRRGRAGGKYKKMRRSRKPFSRRRACAECASAASARSKTAGKPSAKGPQTFRQRLSARSPLVGKAAGLFRQRRSPLAFEGTKRLQMPALE